ncbi:pyrroline-5-carboxylate reductase, partial [Desulfovibrio sp. OttesenSCG-928-A18]|nr:pyrroline-5-carboxylate reductase [Desulfovibrio sp. OttesenSCG-928-A18]
MAAAQDAASAVGAAQAAGTSGGKPRRLGIIGCGNMGSALGLGVLQDQELARSFTLHVFDSHESKVARMVEKGAHGAPSAVELAKRSDCILLAVKPYQVPSLLAEMAPVLAEPGKLLISVAAGLTLEALRSGLGAACPVVRVMPNTLAMAGEGFFGICFDPGGARISELQQAAVRKLFAGLGQTLELDESRMNAFTALAGGGPAYVFYFMEALTQAGVSVGLTRDSSWAIACSLLKGAAALAGQTGAHPAVLREQVCSPGGTSIEAINHLDRTGVRGHIADAVRSA